MADTPPILLVFTRDLRIEDHPALQAASGSGAPVLPVFVLDDETPGGWHAGSASRWWLHHSLAALTASLEALGARLILRRGALAPEIAALVREAGAQAVFASRRTEPWLATAFQCLQTELSVPVRLFAGSTLFAPGSLRTRAGGPYKVFSQFWRAALAAEPPGRAVGAPSRLTQPAEWPESDRLGDLDLLPHSDRASGLRESWRPGEAGALSRLDAFLDSGLVSYADLRDRPAAQGTSRLSPHLAFGEISPRRIWHAALAATGAPDARGGEAAAFLRELGWREFAHHLIEAFPDMPDQPLRSAFAAFPWREDAEAFQAWCQGRTGYPIVDAGMRELRATGWMHNRVRMIAASFLVKDLRIHWWKGERWFWDTLVDADLANNALGWQWVAGCGADAAPYFRVFNPVRQSERFDPEGRYIRRWVPEIAELPDDAIHAPWNADTRQVPATNYPAPLVDHAAARRAALAAFEIVKESA